jgi:hypothetical protein
MRRDYPLAKDFYTNLLYKCKDKAFNRRRFVDQKAFI